MNSVRLPRLRRDPDSKIMAHITHITHTHEKCVPCVPSAMMAHMAHAGRVLALALALAVWPCAGWPCAGWPCAGWPCAGTHGTRPWCCAALVLRGQRPARPCALVLRPWQRRGRGGRAERLGPQLRSVRKQFLFLWYKTEHDVTAVIY